MENSKANWPLKDLVDRMTDYFVEALAEGSRPTTEFSISEENLPEKISILIEADKRLGDCHWVVFRCETCREYNSDKPLHVMILRKEDVLPVDGLLKGLGAK